MVSARIHIIIIITIKYEDTYFPSNGGIANVVHRDLDLPIQGQPFLNVHISETVRVGATMGDMIFRC